MREPLFVLAPDRSLTTTACAMIGNHPDMFALAETHLFAAGTYQDLQQFYVRDPQLAHGLLRTIAELGFGEQTDESIDAVSAWLLENRSLSTIDLFKDIASMAEPGRIIDSSVLYVYMDGPVERIREAFPAAHFLHLSMHPRLTCELVYRNNIDTTETDRGTVVHDVKLQPDSIWLQPHKKILDALVDVSPGQKMLLRGEELFAEPERCLKRICEWLGIRDDAEAVASMMRPEQSPFAHRGPDNAPLGLDPHFIADATFSPRQEESPDLDGPLSWDQQVVFSDNLKRLAELLGY